MLKIGVDVPDSPIIMQLGLFRQPVGMKGEDIDDRRRGGDCYNMPMNSVWVE